MTRKTSLSSRIMLINGFRLTAALLSVMICSMCGSGKPSDMNNNKKANKLINESSPYLLQHAYNPVDWYPWGDEALEKAKAEDKLIIVSVGYAACHWCHVMEHESFEDSLVASIMNENFVSIKVDREERPDVDDVYMSAAQLLNGRGGWPLNAVALADGKPVFAGTYFQKDQWIKILEQLVKLKNEQPDKLKESSEKITEGIVARSLIEVNDSAFDFTQDNLIEFVDQTIQTFDTRYGGRMGAPKFPMPNSYEFLMKYHWYTGKQNALNTVKTALDNMAKGGIYDQIGGGFARYSVDEFWLVPHFEKMLYDNGQLVSVYAQAYQLTKDPMYKRIVEETISFIERELSSPDMGFYSSLDADSEGEEGKFYIWTKDEIASVIKDEKDLDLFCEYYDVSDKGNWEHSNILNIEGDKADLLKKYNIDETAFDQKITEYKNALLAKRSERVRPGLDDKILTSWNALMLKGYVDAYNALGNPKYLQSAIKNASLITSKQMNEDGRLFRNLKDGQSSINAFLDDYALTIDAFTKLYQATFNKEWLDQAEKLTQYAIENFYNEELKMFDFTSKLDPPLIAKKTEYADNVIPSSNSAMARSLFGLGTLNYNPDYIDISKQMLNNMMPQIKETTFLSFYSNWLQLLLDVINAPYEIAIIGDDAPSLRNALAANYLGNSLLLGSTGSEDLELLKEKHQEGRTMIYVCQNKVCKFPVEEVDKALGLLDR